MLKILLVSLFLGHLLAQRPPQKYYCDSINFDKLITNPWYDERDTVDYHNNSFMCYKEFKRGEFEIYRDEIPQDAEYRPICYRVRYHDYDCLTIGVQDIRYSNINLKELRKCKNIVRFFSPRNVCEQRLVSRIGISTDGQFSDEDVWQLFTSNYRVRDQYGNHRIFYYESKHRSSFFNAVRLKYFSIKYFALYLFCLNLAGIDQKYYIETQTSSLLVKNNKYSSLSGVSLFEIQRPMCFKYDKASLVNWPNNIAIEYSHMDEPNVWYAMESIAENKFHILQPRENMIRVDLERIYS